MPETVSAPPAPERRPGGALRALAMLAIASAIALALTLAIVLLVFRAEFLGGAAEAAFGLVHRYGLLAAAAAASPVVAVLLVGYGYMTRAMRRRAAERAAAARAAAGAAPAPGDRP